MKSCISIFVFLVFFSLAASAQQINDATTSTVRKEILVYPNPAHSVVHILGLMNCDRAVIHITDTYGTVVLQHRWEIRNNALSIPISNLETGIYLISIASEEQQVQTKFYKK